jgi:phasin family protein
VLDIARRRPHNLIHAALQQNLSCGAQQAKVPLPSWSAHMFNFVDYLSTLNAANLASAERLARLSLEKSEALSALAWGYSKDSFDDVSKHTRSLLEVKDVNDFYLARTKATEAVVSKAGQFARESYAIASAAQTEVAKMLEERVAALHKSAVEFVEVSAKRAPAGSEAAVAAVKSMVAASAVAFDTLSKASKQAQGYVEAAVKASETTADNVKAFTVAQGKRK